MKRNLETSDVASADWFVSHIGGCMCGFAARLAIPDFSDAWQRLEACVRTYWREHDWETEYVKRRLSMGHDPAIDNGAGMGECDPPF